MVIEDLLQSIRNNEYIFIKIIIVIMLTVIIERIVKFILDRIMAKHSKRLKVNDNTRFRLMSHFISALVYLIGAGIAIYSIPALEKLSISLFASAGVIAIVVGFAAQKAFADIIAGIFIAMFQPFRIGDIIKFQDKIGEVEDINLRHTTIRNFENRRYIVPNAIISDEVIENFNINEEKTCRYVEIGISYDSDIDKAMDIIQDEAIKHRYFIDNRTEEDINEGIPPVIVRVLGFGDSSVNLRGWVWAENPGKAFRMGCDLNKSIKERFDKEGIEIPFPYRTIVYKNDILTAKKHEGGKR